MYGTKDIQTENTKRFWSCNLQRIYGYRYGITEEDGIHVATSNWQQGNFIYMYFYNELTSQWEGLWIDLEDVEIVEEKGN